MHGQLGVVPNMYRQLALSPPGLSGFAGNNGALAKALDVKTRERIAQAAAQVNGCDYCLSAHGYLGLNLARITPDEIALNRAGASGDVKANAAVAFAAKVVRERGHVTSADVQAVRDAGFSKGRIVEILPVTAENIFTNLLNTVCEIDIDFPSSSRPTSPRRPDPNRPGRRPSPKGRRPAPHRLAVVAKTSRLPGV